MRAEDHSFATLSSIARQILSYLLAHPEAKDTAKGIQGWWLAGEGTPSEEALSQALLFLVERSWITQSGTVVYGLNAGALREIHGFLGVEE
jgi:hypothetical protein